MEFLSVSVTERNFSPNRGQRFSPTIASRVRPGGSTAFSEPMQFDASRGGWITEAQLRSTGAFSPGTKENGNGNLRALSYRSPSGDAIVRAAFMPPEATAAAQWKSAIKLGPTERLINKYQQDNPYTLPAYWPPEANSRGWYDKPGEPIPLCNTNFGKKL